jgi:hypothetical protein
MFSAKLMMNAYFNHHGRNFSFAKRSECFHASLATNQQVVIFTVRTWTIRDRDWFLETNLLNVSNDVIKDALIALTWIQYFN